MPPRTCACQAWIKNGRLVGWLKWLDLEGGPTGHLDPQTIQAKGTVHTERDPTKTTSPQSQPPQPPPPHLPMMSARLTWSTAPFAYHREWEARLEKGCGVGRAVLPARHVWWHKSVTLRSSLRRKIYQIVGGDQGSKADASL